jgi:hypothetical protein
LDAFKRRARTVAKVFFPIRTFGAFKFLAKEIIMTEEQSITFLNMSGDVTITWDASNEAEILELVRQKMAQGYSFFILKKRSLGPIPLPAKKVEATSIAQVAQAGHAVLRDKEVTRMVKTSLGDDAVDRAVQNGSARLTQGRADLATSHRAQDAQEVLRSQSVAIRPVVGG